MRRGSRGNEMMAMGWSSKVVVLGELCRLLLLATEFGVDVWRCIFSGR